MPTKPLYSKTSIPTTGWEREAHFHFYRSGPQPFITVHTETDLTPLYHYARWERLPVELAYLHAATAALRATENLRLRLEGDGVVCYEAVDLAATGLQDNKTLFFVHLPYHPDLAAFCQQASALLAAAPKSPTLFRGYQGPELVPATNLPWLAFSGLEPAGLAGDQQGVPQLAFGQLKWQGRQVMLPVSIRVHQALADAYHIHLFLENLQARIQAAGLPRLQAGGQQRHRQLAASVHRVLRGIYARAKR